MAAAVPFLIAAGATMSAMNAIQQGQAAKAAAQFNSTIANQNAQIAREETLQRVRQADREALLRTGAVTAAAGASGGKQQGSVLDVLGDVAAQNEIQRQDIIYRGALEERGYRNTAALDTAEGDAKQRSSYLQAGSELLSGAGNATFAQGKLKRA